MSSLALQLLRRLHPPWGWFVTSLACLAVLCPALAASESSLALPTWWFMLAGLLGFGWGIWAVRPRRWQVFLRVCGAALLVMMLALTLLAIGDALPPVSLLQRDSETFGSWLRTVLQTRRLLAVPESLTANFLLAAVPRLWRSLMAAPDAGEAGARLLLSAGGVLATCIAALVLGWALETRRALLGWSMPLAGILMAIAVLGGGKGGGLAFGLSLLLLLALLSSFRRTEMDWQQTNVDYSDQIERDVLSWGGALIAALITFAAVLPTAANTPLADLLWGKVDLPSGIAVLDRNGARPQAPAVKIALSTLPAVQLGVSLERQPPETIALRIHLDDQLPSSSTPHYWRVRLLNIYDGRQWWSNARVEPNPPVEIGAEPLPGYVEQEIEDLRPQRDVLAGLPNIVSLPLPTQAERLADGTLSAVTSEAEPSRYRVLSQPQEFAAVPSPGEPPNLGDALVVPKNLPPRVAELAQTIAGTGSQAERALAIEAYLRALPYSYTVRPLPNTGDAVDQFLFDMREGYCTYYASAMAIMARSIGIPARVAVGYAAGSYDETTSTYTVRESDAHAWPELYIDGRWTPYEPTPVRPLPARGAEPAAPPAPDSTTQPGPQPAPVWPVLGFALALLTAFGFAFLLRQRQRRAAPISLALELLERAGTKAGLPWSAGATLREYGATLEPRLGSDSQALHRFIDLVERARYHGETLHTSELEQMQALSKQVAARLSLVRGA